MAAPTYPVLPGRETASLAPLDFAATITPNDSTTFLRTRALWVGGAGNIVVRMAGDAADQTLVGVPAGTLLPIAVDRVKATNTTATSIVALW